MGWGASNFTPWPWRSTRGGGDPGAPRILGSGSSLGFQFFWNYPWQQQQQWQCPVWVSCAASCSISGLVSVGFPCPRRLLGAVVVVLAPGSPKPSPEGTFLLCPGLRLLRARVFLPFLLTLSFVQVVPFEIRGTWGRDGFGDSPRVAMPPLPAAGAAAALPLPLGSPQERARLCHLPGYAWAPLLASSVLNGNRF